jgi:LCP family protein required for cell wall assembly
MKQMSKKKKILLSLLAIFGVFIIATGLFGWHIFSEVEETAGYMYRPAKGKNKLRDVSLAKKEPFSTLFLGVKSKDDIRDLSFRSDAIMIVTVNPKRNQTTVTSIPKETYLELVGENKNGRLSHAYEDGDVAMTINSLQKMFNIPIDHYVTLDEAGWEDLVDAAGGITVSNTQDFKVYKHEFPIGELSLNGEEALAYTKMYQEDPTYEYGRQNRQRQVTQAVADKILSVDGLSSYPHIMSAVKRNAKTDLTVEECRYFAINYARALMNARKEQVKGEKAVIDGATYLQVPTAEVDRIHEMFKTELEI